VTSVPPGQPPVPGTALLRLVEVMDTLRVSCPWDRKQTHESLAPYLLEECYEVLDALESGEPAALRDELGDLLLQVVFQARIAADRADGAGFTIDDVAEGIVAKLVRRHPHVFGDVTVSGADEVISNWDTIKGPAHQPVWPTWRRVHRTSRSASGKGPRLGSRPVCRLGSRSAIWARNCSGWWRGRGRPGSIPSWNCVPPPGPTVTGSAPGSNPPAANPAPTPSTWPPGVS